MDSPVTMHALRAVFDPRTPESESATFDPRKALDLVRLHYRDPLAWRVLLVTSVAYCYGAGLVLFWYHSIALGKGGPAMHWSAHWLIDDTIAFLALTPVLALAQPFIAAWSVRLSRNPRRSGAAARPWFWYIPLCGLVFALVTAPGPHVHDAVVGAGTPLAELLVSAIGNPEAATTHAHHYAAPVQAFQQVAAGAVVYPLFMALTVLGVRAGLGRRTLRSIPAGGVTDIRSGGDS